MPMYDYLKLLQSDTANTGDAVTTDKCNFGVTNPGVNKGGVPWGLHVIVTTTFTGLDEGVNLGIVHSANDDLSTSSEVHTKMFVPVAEMVAGAHFFIPAGSRALKQYACGIFDAVSTAASEGKTTMFLGPKSGGEV
ncbi:MAG: hypothetical protein A4E61_00086 [Syntrophorhabdus sp. PtaB.Bin184]|nr:MAG: hypothetical protein A4E61_00086 [Syntrophorhabdus sp. PtaB.Bin184]